MKTTFPQTALNKYVCNFDYYKGKDCFFNGDPIVYEAFACWYLEDTLPFMYLWSLVLRLGMSDGVIKTEKEVGEILKCSSARVHQRVHKCLKKLRSDHFLFLLGNRNFKDIKGVFYNQLKLDKKEIIRHKRAMAKFAKEEADFYRRKCEAIQSGVPWNEYEVPPLKFKDLKDFILG